MDLKGQSLFTELSLAPWKDLLLFSVSTLEVNGTSGFPPGSLKSFL